MPFGRASVGVLGGTQRRYPISYFNMGRTSSMMVLVDLAMYPLLFNIWYVLLLTLSLKYSVAGQSSVDMLLASSQHSTHLVKRCHVPR